MSDGNTRSHRETTPLLPLDSTVDNSISRSELAYRSIRDAILANRLHVKQPLREEQIAQNLGMSRTPVREALGRLHTEGFVEEAKPRGYVVSSVKATDVFHVYEVREGLEGFCLRIAAQRISQHELFQLSTVLEQMERSIENPERFSQLNRRFHAIIYEATQNPVLEKIMDDLISVVERFPVSAYRVEGRARQAIAEHRRIFKALEQNNPQEAELATQEHLRVGLEARLAALREYELELSARADGNIE